MASNNGGKEERRRRIAERGSDRMALITGRINALPPTPPSTTSSPTHGHHIPRHAQSLSAAAAFDSHSDEHHLPPRHQRPQSLSEFAVDYPEDLTGGAEHKRGASLSSARLKHQGGFRYSHMENFDFKTEEEPLIQDSDTITEANNQVSEGDGAKMKPPCVTSSAKIPPHDTQQLNKPCGHKPTFFSSRELNSCILASEPTRALSSLIIALLVVFYYMISESVLASRPLYILLLTDITIVLARLHRGKASVLEETEGERVEAHGDGHSWGDAVKLLERGLVAYQAIRGVFIDCSIYIVVVVCGTSLM
ncbi:Zinc finger FYVE domain-containing protein 26 isoform 1 [Spatholobus suberectus]|nr:Zinc finger FYVE domain-containing protein 26 isoform 1 [Spatholobus suberectus]